MSVPKKVKIRRVQLSVEGSLSGLGILFKEILQLIPDEQAKKLMDGYRDGRTIELYIGQSSYGKYKKTAFGCRVSDTQDWRDLPEVEDGLVN